MIKIVLLFASALSIFIASIFVTPESSIFVEQSFPTEVKPGTEFTVTLTVHKGKQTGFARLQQFLPKGFTAEAIDTKKAQFINDEESAKFIWISLPADEVFSVSYKVKVSDNIDGKQVVNGLFYYIQDEKTQKLALDPIEITVSNSAIEAQNRPNVERKLISVNPDKGEYRVELTIHPNQETSGAQFIDDIPVNFNASAIETFGSTFTFEGQKAVFSWTTFPTESSFTISYLVHSSSSKTAPEINGMLVYGTDENKSESERSAEVIADDATPDSIIDALISSENERQLMAAKALESNNTTASATTANVDLNLPAPQTGIFYKVQICATRKSPARNGQFFEKKYKVTDNVELTNHEGWKKYIIGSFSSYEEAKAFGIKTKELVKDAFIVAYDNGERIPVNQAQANKKINQ
ncbi:MAG: hypothetical protein IPN61_08070 [Bacteroidetes bacterium]|nr:hypothetical protein [Bacteroidota bacterium]MBK9413364.1 hypothetical protein [Bacteroidota bacterium]MBP6427530.1 hypothetical protein [Bacteroidia bacterium]